jgi:hypothetical protein
MKPVEYSIEDGEFLVKLARKAITEYIREGRVIDPPKEYPKKLSQNAGVFVTIETYPSKELRGCIGYPEPIMPLVDATIKSAIAAATQDPRFPHLTKYELEHIILEVSILTPPELIRVKSPKDYLDTIKIGEDGLIVEKGLNRGLLLPQVPVEFGWDTEEFLSHTCMKAGLLPDSWFDINTKVYRFKGVIFSEEKPNGPVFCRTFKKSE